MADSPKITFGLQRLSLYGHFSFLSLDQLYWHYKNSDDVEGVETLPADSTVLLYLPIDSRFNDTYRQYLQQNPEFCCELEFNKEGKKIMLYGAIFPGNMVISIEEEGFLQDVLVFELKGAESERFLQYIAKEKTQAMEQMNRQKTAQLSAVHPRRRHPRLPKTIKIRYRLSMKEDNAFDAHGRLFSKQKDLYFSGETINVSESGIFIKSDFLPPLRSEITASVIDKLDKPIEIHGIVVRRDVNEATSGFAVELIKPGADAGKPKSKS
jgi:hypothetical protein